MVSIPSVHVASVDEARELAWQWFEEDRADWFRGQVSPWPPASTLTRWEANAARLGTKSQRPAIDRFFGWIEGRRELQPLVTNQQQALAVAQHFGLATHFVDFSWSPDVAALFSRDRNPQAQFESELSCIYCLNLDRVAKVFENLPREDAATAKCDRTRWPPT